MVLEVSRPLPSEALRENLIHACLLVSGDGQQSVLPWLVDRPHPSLPPPSRGLLPGCGVMSTPPHLQGCTSFRKDSHQWGRL